MRTLLFDGAAASLALSLVLAVGVQAAPASWARHSTAEGGDAVPGRTIAGTPSGNVIKVRMVTTPDGASGHFKPAHVTANKGDTLRFFTDGGAAHNVSFPPAENVGKSNLPPTPGTYLTAPKQSYDVVVTMDPGTYVFQCDPHAPLGMKGVLTVQ